jgi:hypothetical protein
MSISKHKQLIIHVVTEIIILGIFAFYVSRKNKILTGYIKELSLKVDEQEVKIKQHEQFISSIMENINNIKEKIIHQDHSISELSLLKSNNSEQSQIHRKSQIKKSSWDAVVPLDTASREDPNGERSSETGGRIKATRSVVIPTERKDTRDITSIPFINIKSIKKEKTPVSEIDTEIKIKNVNKSEKIKHFFQSSNKKDVVIEEILSEDDDDESLDIDIQEELEELEELEED